VNNNNRTTPIKSESCQNAISGVNALVRVYSKVPLIRKRLTRIVASIRALLIFAVPPKVPISGSGGDAERTTVFQQPSGPSAFLLMDIIKIFRDQKTEKMSTTQILKELCDDEEGMWFTFCDGKKLNPRRLSILLGEFGLHSEKIRFDKKPFSGFEKEWFIDALITYLLMITSEAWEASRVSKNSKGDDANSDHGGRGMGV